MAQPKINLKNLKGFQARSVSVKHLPELKEDIAKRQGMLDKHLVEMLSIFSDDTAAKLPGAQSLITIAVPQPITRASFHWQGKIYYGDIPPTYIGKVDDARAQDALAKILEPNGFKLVRARLLVKTLAVRSGLAQYGRNNITYVPGYGSFQRLLAFVTDWPCAEDTWGELKAMKACEKCFKCGEICPTQCISADRFLIHAEKCLTFHNEMEFPLPTWIKPEWHNALVGCLCCQLVCPVNKKQLNNIVPGPVFTEEETDLFLQKRPIDSLPAATRSKLADIALDESSEVLGRNLALLINNQKFI